MSVALSKQPMRRPGIVPGILISLALHAALIFCYRLAAPTPPPPLPPNRTMTVWLRTFTPPLTAVEKVRPARPAVTLSAPDSPGLSQRRERTAQARAAAPPGQSGQPAPAPDHSAAAEAAATAAVTATPANSGSNASTASTASTAATTTTAAAATTGEAIAASARPDDPLRAQDVPKFDIEAARRAARRVATDKDTMRADSLAKRLEEHPLYADDKQTALQKGIAGAKRGDCRNTPGGLLAPLVWLLDKKDGGCKW